MSAPVVRVGHSAGWVTPHRSDKSRDDSELSGQIVHVALGQAFHPSHQPRLIAAFLKQPCQRDRLDRRPTDVEPGNDSDDADWSVNRRCHVLANTRRESSRPTVENRPPRRPDGDHDRTHVAGDARPGHAYHIGYIPDISPGQLIRQRRLANGLTQQQLAIRAGSTQAAVSRLEHDEISPTFENFGRLLQVMGEEAELVVRRPDGPYDRARLASLRARPPVERLALALSWNRLAGQLAREGAKARRS